MPKTALGKINFKHLSLTRRARHSQWNLSAQTNAKLHLIESGVVQCVLSLFAERKQLFANLPASVGPRLVGRLGEQTTAVAHNLAEFRYVIVTFLIASIVADHDARCAVAVGVCGI